jgi:hypothetical protein
MTRKNAIKNVSISIEAIFTAAQDWVYVYELQRILNIKSLISYLRRVGCLEKRLSIPDDKTGFGKTGGMRVAVKRIPDNYKSVMKLAEEFINLKGGPKTPSPDTKITVAPIKIVAKSIINKIENVTDLMNLNSIQTFGKEFSDLNSLQKIMIRRMNDLVVEEIPKPVAVKTDIPNLVRMMKDKELLKQEKVKAAAVIEAMEKDIKLRREMALDMQAEIDLKEEVLRKYFPKREGKSVFCQDGRNNLIDLKLLTSEEVTIIKL